MWAPSKARSDSFISSVEWSSDGLGIAVGHNFRVTRTVFPTERETCHWILNVCSFRSQLEQNHATDWLIYSRFEFCLWFCPFFPFFFEQHLWFCLKWNLLALFSFFLYFTVIKGLVEGKAKSGAAFLDRLLSILLLWYSLQHCNLFGYLNSVFFWEKLLMYCHFPFAQRTCTSFTFVLYTSKEHIWNQMWDSRLVGTRFSLNGFRLFSINFLDKDVCGNNRGHSMK